MVKADMTSDLESIEQPELHEEIQEALKIGKKDPIECAREMRQVFSRNNWPNREQPKSVRQVLVDGGIVLMDINHWELTEGQARRARRDQLLNFSKRQ